MKKIYVNQFSGYVVYPREFKCRWCGVLVEIENAKDKRTTYCCESCQKAYWRKRCKLKEAILV